MPPEETGLGDKPRMRRRYSGRKHAAKPDSAPSSAPSVGTEKIWSGALAVAGAAVGLAAIIYFLGAASMWLALRGRGFSPDVAIEHQPRSQLIALGVRGVFAVAIIVVLAAGIAILFRRLLPKPLKQLPSAVVIGLIAVFIASWFGWRWFALAFAAAVALLVSALDWRTDTHSMRRSPFGWFLLLIAGVLTALAWQYGGPVRITEVGVVPQSSLPLSSIYKRKQQCKLPGGRTAVSWQAFVRHWVWIRENNHCHHKDTRPKKDLERVLRSKCTAVPYFGQTGDFVYLGAIRRVWLSTNGTCQWFAGGIIEVPRDKIRLVFFKQKANLNASRREPIRAAWTSMRSFLGSFD